MPLVGDVIIDARLLGPPDPPATLGPPSATSITFSLVPAGTNTPLAAASYYLQAAYTNPWGQTTAGPEVGPLAATGTQVIQVAGNLLLASGVNVYVGGAAGAEGFMVNFTTLPGIIQGTGLGYPLGSVSMPPPLRNSAWIPDSDGAFAPASLVFKWLNSGLMEAAKICGGIPDETGAPSVQSQNTYRIPGTWKSFSKCFYDGYEVFLSSSSDNWYQSAITSLVWNVIARTWVENPVLECFPQAQRTAGQGTLSAPLAATDTVANVSFSTPSGFVVPVTLVLIGQLGGSLGTYEIASYSKVSTSQISNLGRGLGGTSAQAWPSGTAVYELNLHLYGRRYPNSFNVGDSMKSLGVPIEWVSPIRHYVTARFKEAEHEHAQSQALMQEFQNNLRIWGDQNNKRTGRRQAGGVGGIPGTYFTTQFHGVLIN